MEVCVLDEGEGYADILIITDEAYFVAELKNLSLARLGFEPGQEEKLKAHQDLEQLPYRTKFPLSGDKKDKSRTETYKVKDVMDAAKVQVTRYAQALQKGQLGSNAEWIIKTSTQRKTPIQIYPLVFILLGGCRICSAELEPMVTHVQYLPGSRLKGWKEFLKTLNYHITTGD